MMLRVSFSSPQKVLTVFVLLVETIPKLEIVIVKSKILFWLKGAVSSESSF